MLEVIIITLIGFGFFIYSTDKNVFFDLSPILGNKAGEVAFYLYCLTLIPGIMNRLQISSPIKVILMTFRRHLGITMFLTSFMHMCYTGVIPLIVSNRLSLKMFSQHQMMGLGALLALFPLWLTSNDFSTKRLGYNWQRIHRLTYVALFFIYMHTALYGSLLSKFAIVFIILEICSWVVLWRRQALTRSATRTQMNKSPNTATQIPNNPTT